MALKTAEQKADASSPVQTTVLELAMYKQYTWQDVTYEKGKPYRFRTADAMILLQEQDAGRPVWKQYIAPKPRVAPRNEVVDATDQRTSGEPIDVLTGGKRIEVGDDSEIKDILDAGGDVTV